MMVLSGCANQQAAKKPIGQPTIRQTGETEAGHAQTKKYAIRIGNFVFLTDDPSKLQGPGESSDLTAQYSTTNPSSAHTENRCDPGGTYVPMIITGYYKPLENQRRYLEGSYEAEVTMNGQGMCTSSGAKPKRFITAAADKSCYPYGTKFHLPRLNMVVVVQDTGGAIKGPHRLDIFCGEGDEGLDRALAVTTPPGRSDEAYIVD